MLIDPAPGALAWARAPGSGSWTGAVVAFGKHLDEPAIDCGAFLLPPEVFDCQHQAASEGDYTLAGAVTRLAQTHPLRAVALPAGCWWQEIDSPQDVLAARGALRRSLGKDSRRAGQPLAEPATVDPAVDGAGSTAARRPTW